MDVVVFLMGVVIVVLVLFLVATVLGQRDMEAVIEMYRAEVRDRDTRLAQAHEECEHWKDKHAALWSNVAAGLRDLKKDIQARSRHIDADAQEGE